MQKVAVAGLMLGCVLSLGTLLPAEAQVRRKIVKPKFSSQSDVDRANAEYLRERQARNGNPDYQNPARLIEMTFRVAPSISFNTVEGSGAYSQFDANGMGARMSIGPSLDYFFFKDRYAFGTGLWYTVKRSAFTVPGSFGQERFVPNRPTGESVYNLQYLQIPLTVKMYANNIGPNLRGYVQCGGLMDIKLAEKALDRTTNALYKYAMASGTYERQYTLLDLGVLLSAGVQYKLNTVNALNFGLSYQRGLTSVMRDANLDARNNTVAVELGFKF
ncbi:hypothetical protein FAES_1028 [Fibrella aestuarina BUZ 2]|uniref:Outer membrane protein beta-barrel domain-containing protein n=1 Tax=Fibrella aestuarina BUZ 2 TaxID=1166018 RepID=I0K4I6_9BACT|nr:porin family protein [Fibrella aestuarina]CCG99039.1 hypothetical protein FAES_1028 [Fibrella aestuarina BUZ 2]